MISEHYLRAFCCGDGKDIENYAEAIADTTRKWVIHHRKELSEEGDFQYSPKDLIKMKEYYDRPSSELIFLTRGEHQRLHNKGRSTATREKISDSLKGSNHPMYGKKATAEHRENLSKAQKGKPYKHHDITVSVVDDPNAYGRALYHKNKENKRAYYLKNKDEINAKARERYHKNKALNASK